MNFVAALRGELAKHARRPLLWAVAVVPFPMLVGGRFWASHQEYRGVEAGRVWSERQPADLLADLLPESYLRTTADEVPMIGAIIVLILTTLVLALEYSSDTLKVALTQGPSRLDLLAAKATVVATAIATALVAGFGAGAWASRRVAAAEGVASSFPGPTETMAGFGFAFLGMCVWVAVSLLLVVLTRNGGIALAVAFGYLIVVEGVVQQLATESPMLDAVHGIMLTPTIRSVVPSAEQAAASGTAIGQGRAVLTLVVYIVVSLGAAAALLYRRDVA